MIVITLLVVMEANDLIILMNCIWNHLELFQ